MIVVKIERHGDVARIVLPPELLALLGAEVGDTLVFETRSDGKVTVRCKSEVDNQVTLGMEILDEHASTFKALAKDLDGLN